MITQNLLTTFISYWIYLVDRIGCDWGWDVEGRGRWHAHLRNSDRSHSLAHVDGSGCQLQCREWPALHTPRSTTSRPGPTVQTPGYYWNTTSSPTETLVLHLYLQVMWKRELWSLNFLWKKAFSYHLNILRKIWYNAWKKQIFSCCTIHENFMICVIYQL